MGFMDNTTMRPPLLALDAVEKKKVGDLLREVGLI
jgi:hypothetical protein